MCNSTYGKWIYILFLQVRIAQPSPACLRENQATAVRGGGRIGYAGALAVADVFLNGSFDVVVEDVIIGGVLADFLALVPVPEFHLVFLDPDAAAIEWRERERDQLAYGPGRWSVGGLQAILQEETDRIGLWLDTSRQSAEQTVEAILSDLDASRVHVPTRAN